MAKKLNDIVFGGIYEYKDKHGKVIYRGSTEFEDLIEERRSPDWYHREGHVMKGRYNYSVFRVNLRRPIAKDSRFSRRLWIKVFVELNWFLIDL